MEKADIEKLAALARMKLPAPEQEALLADTEKILEFVGQIQHVAVSMDAEGRVGTPHNVFREDNTPHESGIYTDALLNAAPERDRGYVKVQKIL